MALPPIEHPVLNRPEGLFSAQQVNITHDILGLPYHGSVIAVTALYYYPYSQIQEYFPTWVRGDLEHINEALHANMRRCSQFQVDQLQIDFDLWKEIRVSPMQISTAANQVSGKAIVDHEEQRQLLRIRVSNLLGIMVPKDGWLHECEAVLGRSLSEFMQGQGGGRNFGDL